MISRLVSVIFFSILLGSNLFFHGCKCNNGKGVETDSATVESSENPLIKSLTEKIQDEPNNPENYFQRSMAHLQNNSIKNSYEDMQQAIKLDSSNAKYYLALTDIYLRGTYADGAVEALNTLIRKQPDNLEAITKLSKVYFYMKDYQNSLKQIQTLIDKDKNNSEAFFIMGMNYKEMKDTSRAINAFQQAVQRKQDFYDAYMQLGLLHSRIKSNAAPKYFDNALRIDSTNVEAQYGKAKYYQDAGLDAISKKNYTVASTNIGLAKQTYRELINKNPQYQDAYFNLGFIYLQQDSIDKAYKHFDFAIKVSPQYAEAYYYRGLCSELKGNMEQAKLDIENALALKPDYELAKNELENLNKKK